MVWIVYLLFTGFFLSKSQWFFNVIGRLDDLFLELWLSSFFQFQFRSLKFLFLGFRSIGIIKNRLPFSWLPFLTNNFLTGDLIFWNYFFLWLDFICIGVYRLITGLEVNAGIFLSFIVSFCYGLGKGYVDYLCLRLNNFDILRTIMLVEGDFLIGRIGECVIEIVKFDGAFMYGADRFKLNRESDTYSF